MYFVFINQMQVYILHLKYFLLKIFMEREGVSSDWDFYTEMREIVFF